MSSGAELRLRSVGFLIDALTKVTHVLPLNMVDVREYLDRSGRSLYAEWFDSLDAQAAAKVAVAITRMGQGNFSNVKSVGSGVHECRIDFGPGYRVYFGKDGECLVILLGGGTKKRQQKDIHDAVVRWQDYKIRKK
jgi:putative addiction module killer protein